MNLKYNILWFEDNNNWFRVHQKILSRELERNGFDLVTTRKIDADNLADIIQDRRFDLIAVDLKLDNGDKGNDVISIIREHGVYTEVVFYSSSGPLAVRRKMVEDGRHVDGVYCIDRSDFETEVMKVIETTVRKVQDLNNMRGLVMAALADYDGALNDFLLALSNRHNLHDFILEKVKEKVEANYNSQRKSIEKFRELEALDEALIHHNFTSYSRISVVISVLKAKKGCRTVEDLKSELLSFQRELIQERNNLAHVREDPNASPPRLIGCDVEYSDEVFKERRVALRRHLSVTATLLELISAGHFDDAKW